MFDKSENQELKFRRKRPSFTQVPNALIDDDNLSVNAKMLYIIINRWIDAPDFHIYKQVLKKQMKIGSDNTFDKYWKELKDSGYLIQYKSKDDKGKYCYEYELLDMPETNPSDNVDSGKIQTILDEKKKECQTESDDVVAILKHCQTCNYHLSKKHILDLVKSFTKEKIMSAITKAANYGQDIRNPFTYLMSILKNTDTSMNKPIKQAKTNKFNDFEQRKYTREDFINMEKRLLNKPMNDSDNDVSAESLLLGLC